MLSGSRGTEALSSLVLLHPVVLPRDPQWLPNLLEPCRCGDSSKSLPPAPEQFSGSGTFMTFVETAEIRKMVKRKQGRTGAG